MDDLVEEGHHGGDELRPKDLTNFSPKERDPLLGKGLLVVIADVISVLDEVTEQGEAGEGQDSQRSSQRSGS
jgi:hypothetical protein